MGERGIVKKSDSFADVIYGRSKGMAHEPLTNYFALKEHYSRPDRLNINVVRMRKHLWIFIVELWFYLRGLPYMTTAKFSDIFGASLRWGVASYYELLTTLFEISINFPSNNLVVTSLSPQKVNSTCYLSSHPALACSTSLGPACHCLNGSICILVIWIWSRFTRLYLF